MTQTTSSEKYRQAAIAYLIYGIIYLAGAIYVGSTGIAEKSAGPDGGIWYYILGAAFAFGVPILIWKELKWITRILAILVLYRIYEMIRLVIADSGQMLPMPWGSEMPLVWGEVGFIVVAAVNCFFLIRAGWGK